LSALSMAACAPNQQTDTAFDQSDQAFSESSCGSSTLLANRLFASFVDPTDVSVRTYNKCTKSWIVDIESLSSAYTGPGAGGGGPATISVTWADSPLQTEASCTSSGVSAILYQQVVAGGGEGGTTGADGGLPGTGGFQMSSLSWMSLGRQDSAGVWGGGLLGCQIGVGFTGMVAGATYRVAATARAADNTTRRVGITTTKPMILR
jgi:hypothetical protein